ncbi:MAG: HAMP domain-containing sensor histidine kinase, partial [Usitatibacteraceae bacterium]
LGYFQVNRDETGNFDIELKELADPVTLIAEREKSAANVAKALVGLDTSLDVKVASHTIPKDFVMFNVQLTDGSLVAKSRYAPNSQIGDPGQTGFLVAQYGNEQFRVYSVWSTDRTFRIETTQSMSSRQKVFDEVMLSREGLVNPLLVGFFVVLFPVLFAVHTGLKPLRSFAEALSKRSASDLRPVQIPRMYAELVPMVDELNATLARLDALLENERAFLADAAHELRTPLALVTAQCDVLFHAKAHDERVEAARRLSNGLARASRLVNQLLALARLDTRTEVQRRTIDVADLIRDSLANHDGEAIKKNIELSFYGPENLLVNTSGDAMESIINNLLNNAIRYGRDGGSVLIELSVGNDMARIRVADDGPGISRAEQAILFERFRRGKDTASSGSGLGLAIVKAAATQLGARLDVSQGLLGRGVSFNITYPLTHGHGDRSPG